MRNPFVFFAAALLGCMTFSAAYAADEPALSGDQVPTKNGMLVIHPIRHATFLMRWNGKTIYVDPVGGAKAFAACPSPISCW